MKFFSKTICDKLRFFHYFSFLHYSPPNRDLWGHCFCRYSVYFRRLERGHVVHALKSYHGFKANHFENSSKQVKVRIVIYVKIGYLWPKYVDVNKNEVHQWLVDIPSNFDNCGTIIWNFRKGKVPIKSLLLLLWSP